MAFSYVRAITELLHFPFSSFVTEVEFAAGGNCTGEDWISFTNLLMLVDYGGTEICLIKQQWKSLGSSPTRAYGPLRGTDSSNY